MTPDLPEKEVPVRAPARSRIRVLLAIAGIAVLAVSLLMAYREGTHTATRTAAPTREAAGSGGNTTGVVFNIYRQPRALPNIRFVDGKGQAVTLRDFRGKVVLLNIWATWCPPCRAEMPTLDRLRAELGGPDFEVVALSIDAGQQDLYLVQEFYLQTDIKSLGIYMDSSGKASRDLNIAGLPTSLLIDREGREIGRKIGPAEWDSPEIVKLIRGYLAPSGSNQQAKQ